MVSIFLKKRTLYISNDITAFETIYRIGFLVLMAYQPSKVI